MPDTLAYTYIIQAVQQELEDVRSYEFAYGLQPFEFYPGQFVVAVLPSAPKTTAAITLSSSPMNRSQFRLTLKRTGDFGTRFYDSAQTGDLVKMRPPAGAFRLEPTDNRPLCYIARDYTTTGAMSFCQYLADIQSTREVYLVHECTSPQQALFRQAFEGLSLSRLKYTPMAVGKGEEVTAAWIEANIPDLVRTVFYAAGEGLDVKRWKQVLLDAAIPATSIRTERWS